MNEKLKYIYDDIYRWLVFAEGKNAAFLAFMAVVLEQLFSSYEKEWIYNTTFFYILSTLCLIQIIILVSSFVPFLNKCSFICDMAFKTYKTHLSENAIFYTNIFLVDYMSKESNTIEDERTVEKLLCEAGDVPIEVLTKFDRDMIEQIKSTARVATIKVAFFNWTMRIFVGICFMITINLLLCA